MREIKFRGKDKDNNWVYGDLIHGVGVYANKIFILPIKVNLAYIPNCDSINGVQISFETVGQYTGYKDINGNEIYEDDVLGYINSKTGEICCRRYLVKFIKDTYYLLDINVDAPFNRGNGFYSDLKDFSEEFADCDYKFCVIGNKHDIPELQERR